MPDRFPGHPYTPPDPTPGELAEESRIWRETLTQLAADLDTAVDEMRYQFRLAGRADLFPERDVPTDWFVPREADNPKRYPPLPKEYHIGRLVQDVYRLRGYALRLRERNG